jgi:hypothetical protein
VRRYLGEHKFRAYALAFFLIMVPAIPLYTAADKGLTPWIWVLIGIVVMGNVLAILIPR